MNTFDKILTAVYGRNFNSLTKLVKKGADLNQVDNDGRTPLMHAILAENASLEMVQWLIENGTDVNVHDSGQQWTALHFAARDNRVDLVGLLLEHGAEVDAQDIFGNTPLGRNVMNCGEKTDVIRMLLAKGADKNRKNSHGVSPLDLAKTIGEEYLFAE